jgi:hypothetical protein
MGADRISLHSEGRAPRRLAQVVRAAVVAFATLHGGSAFAQVIDCRGLQAQIASLPRGDMSGAARYVEAAQKQRSEIQRTVNYAKSLGCDRQQFLFFGSPPPAQCGPINQQIAKMQANLQTLTAQAQGASGDAQKRALTARYNQYCRDGQPKGLFEQLFGGGGRDLEPLDELPEIPPEDMPPSGGPKAVCVRTCDGAFFPISYTATRGRLGSLQQLCSALCPAAETEVFTYSMNRDIDDSVSASGKPYKTMSYAGKYRSKFDPTCTCKGQGQSWVEALADAEKLLGRAKNDVIVTPEKSDEMMRAPRPGQKNAKAAPKKDVVEETSFENTEYEDKNAPPPQNSGISVGNVNPGRTFTRRDGEERQIPGPDGVTKRVRVIGPTL